MERFLDFFKAKVVKVDEDAIYFHNGFKLTSNHESDCCENHYLSFKDLSIKDFDGLEFNLNNGSFFKPIEGYGIELIPIYGHSVKVPGYGTNNGYYSSNLELILSGEKVKIIFDITECQVISDGWD